MSSERLLLNRIQTPDGTILTSRHRHDYREYTDRNGFTYMVDGGLDYLRRNTYPVRPYKELSVWSTDTFEKIRMAFDWGTYGEDGRGPLQYVKLKDMSTEHIAAVLTTEQQLQMEIRLVFKKELEYREGKDG